ncbi:MAG: tRNA (adenosine(37)-N6)-dimethylallyltransferase MiaA, partial [Erysipelotrichaceae bacterium]|nr:tRNA (adenosine(37)-N6)-dimethylallyltransferase MiaA [Erysipelotrichaceae bacterium]
KHSRQFAKRQGTWFRNQMPIRWYDMEHLDEDSLIRELEVWRNQDVE